MFFGFFIYFFLILLHVLPLYAQKDPEFGNKCIMADVKLILVVLDFVIATMKEIYIDNAF